MFHTAVTVARTPDRIQRDIRTLGLPTQTEQDSVAGRSVEAFI